jgi:hypothetical protein
MSDLSNEQKVWLKLITGMAGILQDANVASRADTLGLWEDAAVEIPDSDGTLAALKATLMAKAGLS